MTESTNKLLTPVMSKNEPVQGNYSEYIFSLLAENLSSVVLI